MEDSKERVINSKGIGAFTNSISWKSRNGVPCDAYDPMEKFFQCHEGMRNKHCAGCGRALDRPGERRGMMKVGIREWVSDDLWRWEVTIAGVFIKSEKSYSTPSNAKRGFHTWRKKALIEMGATSWKADKTDIEFDVIR